MLSCQLRRKSKVPHDIIRVGFTLPQILIEVLIQLIVIINRLRSQSQDKISLKLSRHIDHSNESEDISFWYNIMVSWLFVNGLNINNLPPHRYNHKIDRTLTSRKDCNKVIHQEIRQIYIRHKWINPLEPLPPKMLYFKEHFMPFPKWGLIIRSKLHSYQMH